MAEGRDAHVDVDPQRAHQPADRAHAAEDGHVPGVVEHAAAVKGERVRIQAEVAVAPKVRAQDAGRVFLRAGQQETALSDMASHAPQALSLLP